MNGIVKVLTGILGVLAVAACLATVGIIGYSIVGGGNDKDVEVAQSNEAEEIEPSAVPTAVPEETASPDPDKTPAPIGKKVNSSDHVHDYKESVEKKANCYSAGRLKYTCECGDTYYVDIMSTGHVPGEWEEVRKATAEREGLRVKKCIYCDEIVAQENVLFKRSSTQEDGTESEEGSEKETETTATAHIHQYTASTEREPSCTLAGLRKYTCSCGNFYTEMIPAPGHVASDWTIAAGATATELGTEQRTCKVCGVVLDSRPTTATLPNPSSSAGQTSASPAASTSTSGNSSTSASPSTSAHVHDYKSIVLKEANCTEKGVRSFTCSCGSSYAESIELNLDNHTYRAVVIPATATTQGYTVYTCVRCNYSYFDNYSPALGN